MRTDSTISWYNENEGRAYPIAETATRLDNNGNTLPPGIIVDIGITVPPEHEDVYVGTVRITDRLISVSLYTALTGILIGTYSRSTIQPYVAYPLVPVIDNVSGWITFGSYRSSVLENYRFSSSAQSGLETRVVKVIESLPVKRFLRLAGSPSVYASKAVKFEAGTNMAMEANTGTNTLIIKINKGSDVIFSGPCKDRAVEEICGTPPVRKINGVCPDESGRLTLRFE